MTPNKASSVFLGHWLACLLFSFACHFIVLMLGLVGIIEWQCKWYKRQKEKRPWKYSAVLCGLMCCLYCQLVVHFWLKLHVFRVRLSFCTGKYFGDFVKWTRSLSMVVSVLIKFHYSFCHCRSSWRSHSFFFFRKSGLLGSALVPKISWWLVIVTLYRDFFPSL